MDPSKQTNLLVKCLVVFVLFSVLLMLAARNVLPDLGQGLKCAVLDKTSYVGSEDFEPRDCVLAKYDRPTVTECFDRLSDLKSSREGKKTKWHISFMGDSRIRQMYHMLNQYPKYDVEFAGHMNANRGQPHDHAYFTSSLVGFTVSHRWMPYPDHNMEADLRHWIQNKQEAPDVLVTGQMLWTMQHVYLSPFEKYARNMTRITKLLRQLNRTTTVIWWDQEYIKEKEFTTFFSIYKDINIDTRRVKKYNALVRELLRGSDVIIWDSTHHILTEYERACAMLRGRDDPDWYWRCLSDVFHPGFSYVKHYVQQLLNYFCNPVMQTDQDVCCSANRT